MPLGFLGNMISTGINAQIAQNNLNFQKENLVYQKELQDKIFSREDSAIQRRVADLEKAGLSPTLATGQGAGAGQVVPTQAPHNQFQMAMNLLPSVGSIMDTFTRLYNARWYAQAGLPIGYNPSDLGSALMMSVIGGSGDKLIDSSIDSVEEIIGLLSGSRDNPPGDNPPGDNPPGSGSGANDRVRTFLDAVRDLFKSGSRDNPPGSGSGFSGFSGSGVYRMSDIERLYTSLRSRYRESLSGSPRERHIVWTRMYEDAYQFLAKKYPKKDSASLRSQAERIVHVALNSKPSRHGMWRY